MSDQVLSADKDREGDDPRHDVFISYSHQDKTAADAICALLERDGFRCWIAPRDVQPGVEWAKSIIRGINGARVFVLLFSNFANASSQVSREVERAANRQLPILPFRIEDVAPNETLEYFISSPHWMDALSPPLEAHIERLSSAVERLLNSSQSSPAGAAPSEASAKASSAGQRGATDTGSTGDIVRSAAGVGTGHAVGTPRPELVPQRKVDQEAQRQRIPARPPRRPHRAQLLWLVAAVAPLAVVLGVLALSHRPNAAAPSASLAAGQTVSPSRAPVGLDPTPLAVRAAAALIGTWADSGSGCPGAYTLAVQDGTVSLTAAGVTSTATIDSSPEPGLIEAHADDGKYTYALAQDHKLTVAGPGGVNMKLTRCAG
jgi:hypothetical protein